MLSFIEPVCKKVCTDALYEYFGNKFWPQMLIKEVPKVLTHWEQLLAYAGAIDPRLAAAVGAGVFVVGGIIYRVTHRDGQAVVEPVAATETKTQPDSEEKEAAVDLDQQNKDFERRLVQELAEQEAARKAEQEEAVKQEAAKKAEREEAARKLAEQETARKAEQEEAVKQEAAKKADEQKAQKQAALQRKLKAEREKAELQQLAKPQGAVAPSPDFAQRLQKQSIALAKEQELKKEEERKANEARQKALDKAPAVEREEAATFEARREEAKAVFKAEVERKKTMVPAAPAPVAVDEQMYRVAVTSNTFVSAYLNHCQNPSLKVRAKTQRQQVTNEILNGFGVVNGQIPANRVPAFNAELDRLDLGQFKVGL